MPGRLLPDARPIGPAGAAAVIGPIGPIGPSLPMTESVRFTVAAAEVCRVGFTVLGRRSALADARADRAGVGAASRHLGAALAVWASLAPDAVALVDLAAAQRQAILGSAALAELVDALESDPLTTVAAAFLFSMSAAVSDTIAAAGPADGRLVTGLRIVELHLADARAGVGPGPTDAKLGATGVVRVSTATLGVLASSTKGFSSPLTVPKSLATNHPTW